MLFHLFLSYFDLDSHLLGLILGSLLINLADLVYDSLVAQRAGLWGPTQWGLHSL